MGASLSGFLPARCGYLGIGVRCIMSCAGLSPCDAVLPRRRSARGHPERTRRARARGRRRRGVGAVAFRYLILGFTYAFTGHRDYSAAGHASYGYVHGIGIWFVVLAPVVGGLIYGPLIYCFAREARGHGVPEVMLAVAERGGRIRPQVAVVKSLASALCIGSGGSVGREGPIVQIGSALGSTLGQVIARARVAAALLVACGAAGGISATFNAPIAGVFFALELILRNFEAESFGVVVLSSFVADMIGRAAFGSQPFLTLPGFQLHSPVEYPLYAGLGLARCARRRRLHPRSLRRPRTSPTGSGAARSGCGPPPAGCCSGSLLLAVPEMYGVGYPPLEQAVAGHYVVWLLLAAARGKIARDQPDDRDRRLGRRVRPVAVHGRDARQRLRRGVAPPAAAARPRRPAPTGSSAWARCSPAAARAPITAVIIIFELTGDYRIILPLMFAIALATGVSNLLSRDTIYTLKLRRRGIDLIAAAART